VVSAIVETIIFQFRKPIGDVFIKFTIVVSSFSRFLRSLKMIAPVLDSRSTGARDRIAELNRSNADLIAEAGCLFRSVSSRVEH